MTTVFNRVRPIAAVSALIVAAACGNNEGSMDESLKRDLASVTGAGVELAPRAQSSQLVISAVEAAQVSAPAASTRKLTHRIQSRAPSPATTVPRPVSHAEAPARTTGSSPTPVAEPAPLPPVNRAPTQRQSGTYKTEAEIFRQMPWIKP